MTANWGLRGKNLIQLGGRSSLNDVRGFMEVMIVVVDIDTIGSQLSSSTGSRLLQLAAGD